MKRLIILFVFITTMVNASAQCLTQTVFKTDSLGNEKEKIFFPLTFSITNDSLHVSPAGNGRDVLAFAIKEKKECKWNNDLTEGFSQYILKPANADKSSEGLMFEIRYTNFSSVLKLLYPDSEERVFTIKKE